MGFSIAEVISVPLCQTTKIVRLNFGPLLDWTMGNNILTQTLFEFEPTTGCFGSCGAGHASSDLI